MLLQLLLDLDLNSHELCLLLSHTFEESFQHSELTLEFRLPRAEAADAPESERAPSNNPNGSAATFNP